ncbi:MAG: MFS transporter, partial [Actinomycetota bacterium]|nr:MFS transporter [Actinomycetota bacterium]
MAGVVGGSLVRRFRRGVVIRVAAVGLCAGVVLYCSTTALALTLLAALIAGTMGSTLVNAHSTVLTARHGDAGPAAISEANAAASALGVLGPLAVGGAAAVGLGWRAGILVTVALACAVLALGRGVAVPDADTHGAPDLDARTGSPAAARRLPLRYWGAWLTLVLTISVEFSMTVWASDLLRERTGLGGDAAAAALTAFVGGMTAGRLAGARYALKRPVDVLLVQALVLTGAGFAVFWLSTTAWLSLVGLVLVGVGVALHFPLGIARALAASAGRHDA